MWKHAELLQKQMDLNAKVQISSSFGNKSLLHPMLALSQSALCNSSVMSATHYTALSVLPSVLQSS